MSAGVRAALGALTCLVLGASGAAAQSLLSAQGFGMPFVPADGRGIALGGIGMGLVGGELSVVDPAAAARLRLPSVGFTIQSSWAEPGDAESTEDFSGTRFPFLAVGYPAAFGTVTLSLGGYLDQRWDWSSTHQIDLDGSGAQAMVTDRFRSNGGISSVRLGFARRLTDRVDVGVQLGRHIGDVSRIFTRNFDSLAVGGPVQPYNVGGRWSYRGWVGSVGAAADVGSSLRLAASWSWASDLDALPDDDTDGGAASIALPNELRVGGTVILSPLLRATFGAHHSGWSTTASGLADGTARDTFEWGGGIEWSGASVLGKPARLRFGYRDTPLPFAQAGTAHASESALVGGLGIDLLATQGVTLSRLDLALERGSRTGERYEERFWRLSTSVRLSGF